MPKRGKDPGEEGTLVGTGGFGVDSRRAVKVLRDKQAGALVRSAPLLWVRLASLSGASRAVVIRGNGRFEARFDGTPLPRTLLARPYDAYLGAMDAPEVFSLFGQALLHLARPRVTVEVVSGAGDERFAIYLDGPGAAPPAPADDGADETVVRAYWDSAYKPERGHPDSWDPAEMAGEVAACPFPVTVGSPYRTVPVLPWRKRWGREAYLASEPPLRVGLRVLPEPGGGSFAALSVHGVSVEEFGLGDFPLPVVGWVDDPRLSLTASMAKVAANAARERAEAAARRAAPDALLAALERHRARMGLVAKVLQRDGALRNLWEQTVEDREAVSGARGRRGGAWRKGWLGTPSADASLVGDAAIWTRAWRAARRAGMRARPNPALNEVRLKLAGLPLRFDAAFRARPLS